MRIPLIALVLCASLLLLACDEDEEVVDPDPTVTSSSLLPPPEPIPDDWLTTETSTYDFRHPPDWPVDNTEDAAASFTTSVMTSWDPTDYEGMGLPPSERRPPDGVKIDIVAGRPEVSGGRPSDAEDTTIDGVAAWIIRKDGPFEDDDGDAAFFYNVGFEHGGRAFSINAFYFDLDTETGSFAQILSSLRLE